MLHLLLAITVLQDDVELAEGLARRGWTDLAEGLYRRDQGDPASRLGLARLKRLEAERESDPERKLKLLAAAVADVRAFLAEAPGHARAGEGQGELGDLFELEGRVLAGVARLDEAEAAFGRAESLFHDVMGALDARKPDREDASWDGRRMEAEYRFGLALFAHAEAIRRARKPAAMALFEKMIVQFRDSFLWKYGDYAAALDANLHVGRAFQALAEESAGTADEPWGKALNAFSAAMSPLKNPQERKNEAVREIGARAATFSIRAWIAWGDLREGGAATKRYLSGAAVGIEFFKLLPKLEGETAMAVKVETGRALCKAGKLTEGRPWLEGVRRDPAAKGSAWESRAIELLAEFFASSNPKLAIDAADDLFERGCHEAAISQYRAALALIKDGPTRGHCWLQIGRAYAMVRRHTEAISAYRAAMEQAGTVPEESRAAATGRLESHRRLKAATKDAADEAAFRAYRDWYLKNVGGEDDAIRREGAIDMEAEKKYEEAARLWQQLADKPDGSYRVEATFAAGFDWFRAGDSARAAPLFRRHLELVAEVAQPDRLTVRDAMGSVIHLCKILLADKKAEEVLKVAEGVESRFPQAEPRPLLWVMLQRVNARVSLGRLAAADGDLAAMETLYKRDGIGVDVLSLALSSLAQGHEAREQAIRAAQLWHRYFELNPLDPKKDGARVAALADRLYSAGVALSESGGAEGKDLLGKARDLFVQLRAAGGLSEARLGVLRLREARCLRGLERFDDAIEILRELAGADHEISDGVVWEMLADAYVAKGKSLGAGRDRIELVKRADEIYVKLASLLVTQKGAHYWRMVYGHAECLWETDLEGLRAFFDTMTSRGYAPSWDGKERAAMFEGLRKKLEAKLPARK